MGTANAKRHLMGGGITLLQWGWTAGKFTSGVEQGGILYAGEGKCQGIYLLTRGPEYLIPTGQLKACVASEYLSKIQFRYVNIYGSTSPSYQSILAELHSRKNSALTSIIKFKGKSTQN